MVEIIDQMLDSGTTNSNGDVTLTSPNAVNSSKEFVIRNGTGRFGEEVDSVTVTPLSLSNIRLFSDSEIFEGDKLLVTAQIIPTTSVSDLSGYQLVFSGAITGTYLTDRNGQVNVYYTGQGNGSKTVTVTAGNWSASKTFNDLLAYWNTPNSKYPEKYTLNQGFNKLTQYYSLDTSQSNFGFVCIGDYSSIGDWELSFRIIQKVTDVYFDIFSWSGNPSTLSNVDTSRMLSFNPNDIIKARCVDGTLTVTRNNVSLFTKTLPPNQYPGIMVMTPIPNYVDVSSSNPYPTSTVKTLTFNELKLMEL